jgi:hypothetical protein
MRRLGPILRRSDEQSDQPEARYHSQFAKDRVGHVGDSRRQEDLANLNRKEDTESQSGQHKQPKP